MLRESPRFTYLADPLFVVSCSLYATNRWLIKPLLSPHEVFLRGYFNDLLLVPCALPPVLFLHRLLGLRKADHPPTAFEITLHLVVWSIVCEWVGPRFVNSARGDPFDVLAYASGALVSWMVWMRIGHRAVVPPAV